MVFCWYVHTSHHPISEQYHHIQQITVGIRYIKFKNITSDEFELNVLI